MNDSTQQLAREELDIVENAATAMRALLHHPGLVNPILALVVGSVIDDLADMSTPTNGG